MTQAKRVLLLEDDEMLAESLAEQLGQEGEYAVVRAGDCATARERAADGLYEFMILDVGLPDGDGRDLCRELRAQGVTCPIVLLTAADSDADTIAGLDSGANDYITKPFRFAVLMARVHAHLRSHDRSEEAMYRIGPYTFRPSAKLLLDAKSRKIRLTEKETNILKFLYRMGETVPRETLLNEVWGYNPAVTTHTLETHIYRLRQKIEENPGDARILITETGGYRLLP
ncbi:response regulator transcription factor [Rhizomicrobium electricum]|jgi:DNA-binding response OmpR family regulator|uniref:Response regulator transcription factor n=1 Tax=Rhizomicrobium electricum TaxID=480070 RepID=A0ABN1FDA0_9PROT|nr:response regulator transcription factor [Rhizomicrobium electricum]NIJ49143.1 DNA-binding response OmpR family regulator [Rhizomicrobium electricum]